MCRCLWPDATTRWATADRGGCGPRERARLVHLRGASRALRESIESCRRSLHRAQTKQTCGWWRDTLVMDAIDTEPADAAGRVQPLCVPCAGAPLQTAPWNAAAARRRPAATGMQFTCAHNQLRPRALASFLYAPHEILQAARQACLVTRLWSSGAVQACSGSTWRTQTRD